MCYGQMLITHPNGCQQAIPFRAGMLRLGSAPDNDFVIVGPGIAPHHATIRSSEHGDLLIAIGGHASQPGGAALEIELPRTFAPAALVRIGGYVLRYLSAECMTIPIGNYVLRASEAPWSAARELADDQTMLLQELLNQYASADATHEAVTIEMTALR